MRSRDELLSHLYSLTNRGIKLGLDSMRSAAALHGNPQNGYPSVLVGGTNGKGSTCAFIESVLRRAGLKTGLYTSPHLVCFEERFAVNGMPVSSHQWLEVYRDLEGTIDRLQLTFFEAATLVAFELFKRLKVDWAVFEVGLGGRLDATNILQPRACAITSIDFDHMQYLGNSLSSIAQEKLGIARRDTPLFMTRPIAAEVEETAVRMCAATGADLRWIGQEDANPVHHGALKTTFTYRSEKYSTVLGGEYQVGNALIAVEMARAIGITDPATVRQGIAGAWLPGRFQIISRGSKTLVFDVAHNPAAVERLVSTLGQRFAGASIVCVTGVMEDKEYERMIPRYCSRAAAILLTRPRIARAADPEKLKAAIPPGYCGAVTVVPSVADAVMQALDDPQWEVVCVSGSFYTVGEAISALGIEPFRHAPGD